MVVDIEPDASDEGASDVVIRGNDIGTYGLTDQYDAASSRPAGASGAVVRDVTLTGNTVAGNRAGNDGPCLGLNVWVCGDHGPRADFVVTDNVAPDGRPGPAMNFTESDGVTVTGNSQPLSSGELATFPGSTGVTYRR